MTTEERQKMLEKKEDNRKIFKFFMYLFSIVFVLTMLSGGFGEKEKSRIDNDFNWNDSNDVGEFIDYTSDQQEKRKQEDGGW